MKIVMLGSNGDSSAIVYNKLVDTFGEIIPIFEGSTSKILMIKRRIKKLGICKVFGQILFKVICEPKIRKAALERRKEILEKNGLSTEKNFESSSLYRKVESVNDEACIHLLQEINPDIVVVNGTRIISEKVLNCIEAPFINMHMGITPKYRGVHGGYWALVENDAEHCGVTIHKVDKGIDTGKILYQEKIYPTEDDNMLTYTYLQAAAGVLLEIQAIHDFYNGGLKEKENPGLPSKLWYHPTIWEYYHYGIK